MPLRTGSEQCPERYSMIDCESPELHPVSPVPNQRGACRATTRNYTPRNLLGDSAANLAGQPACAPHAAGKDEGQNHSEHILAASFRSYSPTGIRV